MSSIPGDSYNENHARKRRNDEITSKLTNKDCIECDCARIYGELLEEARVVSQKHYQEFYKFKYEDKNVTTEASNKVKEKELQIYEQRLREYEKDILSIKKNYESNLRTEQNRVKQLIQDAHASHVNFLNDDTFTFDVERIQLRLKRLPFNSLKFLCENHMPDIIELIKKEMISRV